MSEPLTSDDKDLLEQVSDMPAIIILNKADLNQHISDQIIMELVPKAKIIRTSTVSDIGLSTIEEAIEEAVNGNELHRSGYSFITNVRHQIILKETMILLEDVQRGIIGRMPYDLIEMDLKGIFDLLGRITGDTISEDLIESVFSQFCLGK